MISLHKIITDVIADTGLSDPREIAARAAALVTPADIEECFGHLLVAEVRNVLGDRRNTALDHVMQPDTSLPVPPTPSVSSRKVAGIRDWWTTLLESSVHIGGARWMTLGDCGKAELAYLAGERRVHASRELARAGQYDLISGLMRRYKVKTVKELPPDAVRRALGKGAA